MAEIMVLRLLHILGGIFWIGSAFFISVFLVPALGRSSREVVSTMTALHHRKLFVALPIVGLLVILAGLRLMWIDSSGFSASYFATPSSQGFVYGGAAAILAFLLAFFFLRPAVDRMVALDAQIVSATEAQRSDLVAEERALQIRLSRVGAANTTLLVLAAIGMAISRYLA